MKVIINVAADRHHELHPPVTPPAPPEFLRVTLNTDPDTFLDFWTDLVISRARCPRTVEILAELRALEEELTRLAVERRRLAVHGVAGRAVGDKFYLSAFLEERQ